MAIFHLTRTLAAVAPRLDEAGARQAAAAEDAAARRIIDELVQEGIAARTRDSALPALDGKLAAQVVPWLDDPGAATAAQRLLDGIDNYLDPGVRTEPRGGLDPQARLAGWLDGLALVAPRLSEPAAATAASRLLGLIGREPSAPKPDEAWAALRALAARLDLQGKVDLLKHPACVGPARDAVLQEAGKQLDQKFADVWDLVDWLAEHHPEIDLLSPPQPPRP